MAETGFNKTFPIYNDVGGKRQSFFGLVLRKATFDSTVMSLGDKITGDVYYPNNELAVSMGEYIIHNDVKYSLVNPPTIVKEGMASDNSEQKGMTKYSFEFYHPMCQLGNMAFSDVAVSSDERQYLSESKSFSWIGYITDFAAKLNKNLTNTEWVVVVNEATIGEDKLHTLSEVLSFDNVYISDALKTAYDTWEVPYVVDVVKQGEYKDADGVDYYAQGKRFVVIFGLPSNEIYALDSNNNLTTKPFVFRYGQGVGLKNGSRTPKNNKIITRIAGYGSENNIPYGYPQIEWQGNKDWNYTLNNASGMQNVVIDGKTVKAMSYPIYNGILGGRWVRLIKHPFTRTHLMPSIYRETLNKKVNPYAIGYNPNIDLVDYYDADDKYPNPIVPTIPSYEIHEFEDVKPELGEANIISAVPYGDGIDYITYNAFSDYIWDLYDKWGRNELGTLLYSVLSFKDAVGETTTESYRFRWTITCDAYFADVTYDSDDLTFKRKVLRSGGDIAAAWIDDIDDEGNYVQSYFEMTLPQLEFDIYACAAITQEMQINMRSGACIGSTFTVQIDWEDYKKVFYDDNGNFVPDGEERLKRLADYPYSNKGQITVLLQKEDSTFGKIMPNMYQYPKAGDAFVILGISLPTSYIASAENRLKEDMLEYMLENNIYHFDYPLKFDEHFLATYPKILEQIRGNTIIRFLFNGDELALYVKQMAIKYGDSPLPQYTITLTDDVEVVLNQIGQVTDDVSRVRVQMSELQRYYGTNVSGLIASKLSRTEDDTAEGKITFANGLNAHDANIDKVVTEEIASSDFVSTKTGARLWRDHGYWTLEVDDLNVRRKLYAKEVQIESTNYIDGATVLSGARMVCVAVEEVKSVGQIPHYLRGGNWGVAPKPHYYTLGSSLLAIKESAKTMEHGAYRCYFNSTDPYDGTKVRNKFQVGDFAYCQTFNLVRNAEGKFTNQYYWRLVVGVGEDFIDLAKYEVVDGEEQIPADSTSVAVGSLRPMVGDKIVQRGNLWDVDRQTVLELAGSGSNAPYIRGLNNIDSFGAVDKATNVSFKLDGKDNYIRGDIQLVSYGNSWATDVFDNIDEDTKYTKDSLHAAGIKLDGENSNITLTADTTVIRNGRGTTIAMFTTEEPSGNVYFQTSLIKADELEVNKVKCVDKNGKTLRTINEDDNGLDRYYYSDGKVLMEQQWITDSKGRNIGITTTHYDTEGVADWVMAMDGTLTILTPGTWRLRYSKMWAISEDYAAADEEVTYINLTNAFDGGAKENIIKDAIWDNTTNSQIYVFSADGIEDKDYKDYDGLAVASDSKPTAAPKSISDWFNGYALVSEYSRTVINNVGKKEKTTYRYYQLYLEGKLIDEEYCNNVGWTYHDNVAKPHLTKTEIIN